MKKYNEVKIKSINDLKIGDIFFLSDNTFALVISKDETLLHQHTFVRAVYDDGIIERYYGHHFKSGETILRYEEVEK